MMICGYEYSIGLCAALAAFTDDPQKRHRYEERKRDCETAVKVLSKIYDYHKEKKHDT